MGDFLLVLVSSPLGGPDSWQPVAAELNRRGVRAAVCPPTLDEDDPKPLWSQQASAVASAVASLPGADPIVLVGHSGATAILPAAGRILAGRVSGYVLVDGPVPEDGCSQLEMMRAAMPGLAVAVERTLAAGDRFPDARASQQSSAQAGTSVTASPRGRRFFEEAIHVPGDWPDAPCCYISLGPELGPSGAEAERRGWPVRRLGGHHFLMLSAPVAFADALVGVTGALTSGVGSRH